MSIIGKFAANSIFNFLQVQTGQTPLSSVPEKKRVELIDDIARMLENIENKTECGMLEK
jgi:hypothetical protein